MPGNKKAVISWEEVPGAESYNLFETRHGIGMPDVAAPYEWTGLENGTVYAFTVTADMPADAGDNAVSNIIETIPLSPRSLAPWAGGTGYQSTAMEWWDYPGITEYTVDRSLSPDGPWEVRQNVIETIFTDTRVDPDTRYYYRIYPTGFPNIKSESISAVPGRFSRGKLYHVDTNGTAQGVAVDGSYVYVAVDGSGLAVVDISDPANPGAPIYRDMDYRAMNVTVAGGYAYIPYINQSHDKGGLAVIDISTPSAPGEPVYLDTGDLAWDVAVDGDYAYLANGQSGLTVVDVSTPLSPSEEASQNYTESEAAGIDVMTFGEEPDEKTYAFIADQKSGLVIIDVTDQSTPGTPDDDNQTPGAAHDVTVAEIGTSTYAFIADGLSGLTIIDVSDPLTPGTPVNMDTEGRAEGIILQDTTAYLADGNGGLAIIDVTDPTDPGSPVYQDTFDKAVGVDAGTAAVCVADYNDGLAVMDNSVFDSIGSPVYMDTDVDTVSLDVEGSYAYIGLYDMAGSGSGLQVADISNPAAPAPSGFEPTAGVVSDVETAGSCAFAAYTESSGTSGGLAVMDITDPSDPVTVSDIELPGFTRGVAVAGQYLFLGVNNTMAAIDISDPANPGEPAYTDELSGNVFDVAVSGTYAFATYINGTSGLAVIDVSDPGAPVIKTTVDIDYSAYSITIAGDYAYVANVDGLTVVDISDPENPSASPHHSSTPGFAYGVGVAGSFAFIADAAFGLTIIDIFDPLHPGNPVNQDTRGKAYDIEVAGNYGYLALTDDDPGEKGLAVIKLEN